VLLSGYIVHVGLTGMRTCYVRAVGRPGLEATYSTVWTICNAALTVPLALLAGMIGVVSATAVTGIFASVYFVVLCRRAEGVAFFLPSARWWVLARAAAFVTVAGELMVLRTGVEGYAGLLLSALPPLVALILVIPLERRRSGSTDARMRRIRST
jgi:O-antigen/teichoic acid export membrane protein